MPAAPIKVNYLLAVWGEQFIRQFMDLSLRTLLSQGNIPAMAAEADSTFTFLTRRADRKIFANHPMFKRLEAFCRVEFIVIDDLIFAGNYSATLTLAYERGMRQGGESRMLSTYFIYLVADYVMADGAISNLLPHMKAGVSGITAGNFQVVEEDLLEAFIARIDPITGVLTIPPRELMRMTLPHLHPLTTANIVNQDYSHTQHTNRLFWRLDEGTLVGRFYLRHMLAIKPELSDYVIGASCDYSFIAEMCPSGNVVDIADSDEYCVIELQPFAHEQKFIKHGPFRKKNMLASLSKWLTSHHRSNAFKPVIFHAEDISPEALAMVEKSRDLVEELDAQLPVKTQPLRGHPYWISCLEGILDNLIQLGNQDDYYKRGVFAGIIGSKTFEPPLKNARGDHNLLKMMRYTYGFDWRVPAIRLMRSISGTEAECRPWHREYAHSRAISKAIRTASHKSDHFFILSPQPTSYTDWAHKHYGARAVVQKSELFAVRAVGVLKEAAPKASEAVLLLPVDYLHKMGELLAKCDQVLEGDKHVTVIMTQRYFAHGTRTFRERLAVIAAYYHSNAVKIESFSTVTNLTRKWLDNEYQKHVNILVRSKLGFVTTAKRLLSAACVLAFNTGYFIGNMLSLRRRYPHRGDPTLAILRLKLTGKGNIVLGYERRLRDEMLYD